MNTQMEPLHHPTNIVCVAKEKALLGECPQWSPEDKLLYWLDIFGSKIFAYDPITKNNQNIHLPSQATSINLKKQGGLILTLHKEIVGFDFQKNHISPFICIEENLPDNRCNDASCDAKGRLWIGTMNKKNAKIPSGSLYRVDPDGSITCIEKNLACSNGIGWSPDHATMYFAETFKHAVFAYDFDLENGLLSNKRIFVSADENTFLDGLAVDEKGRVWIAASKIGKILCYHPNGKLSEEIDFPVPFPTSCGFGGEDFSTLYMTSSRELLSSEEELRYPLSGSLFAMPTKFKGLPPSYFGGLT